MPTPQARAIPRLILGSTSTYRRELLSRLQRPFEVVSPQVTETARPGEQAAELALRLALEKAHEVAGRHRDAVVIGADQVADLNGVALGKPGTHARAVEQLQALRGQRVVFHTAVAVVCLASGYAQARMATAVVRFRDLTDAEIERYLVLDQPYDCAGSAKCESLGIALLDSIESDDPTALIGLPLIRTSALLRDAGIDVLAPV